MIGHAEVTKVAHGRKRILGGKVLLVVAGAIGAIIAWSRWHDVSVYGVPLLQRIAHGRVELIVMDDRPEKDVRWFHRRVEGEDAILNWWCGCSLDQHRYGVFIVWHGLYLPSGDYVTVGILLWPPALLLLVTGAASWRMGLVASRRWTNAQNACPACGYARVGLAEVAPCPECGRAAV